MKPKLRNLLLAASTVLAASSLHAATLTWDANGATASQTDGAAVSGNWDTGTNWWTGTTNTGWTTGDNAIFGNNGAGGAVTLTSPTTVNSLTSNQFTGTYTLGTTLQAITLNGGLTGGITLNASRGTTTIISPLILGAAQTWTNKSPLGITGTQAAGSLIVGTATDGIDNGGNLLTIGGIGVTQFKGVMSGTGGLTKNGSGTLILGANPSNNHTYSGTTTINGGVVRGHDTVVANKNNVTGTGNLTINEGAIELYFGGTYNRALGAAAGEVQILGGTSGFSSQGNTSTTFNIGGAAATLVWGSTYFKPTTFVLQASTVNSAGQMTLSNGIDLNGATRTIASLGGDTSGSATVSGAIIDTPASGAGLNKIGSGNLVLAAANTYTGATSITGAIVPSAPTTYSGSITLSGSGTLNSTSALNLNGGTLRLTNTAQVDRVNDSAAITSAGSSGITYTNTSGANTYTESLGAITHSSGQFNIVEATNQASTGSQTLTLAGLTLSGTSAVTFSAATTGPEASGNKNMIVVTGAGTTASNEIIGSWATTGTAAASQTDYAAYSSNYVVPANIAASEQSTWSTTTSATSNYTMSALDSATISGGTKNINSLRSTNNSVTVTAASPDIALASHTLSVGDVVTFSATTMPTGLTAGTPYYVVATGSGTIQVSATSGGVAITPSTTGTAVVASGGIQVSSGNDLGTKGILNGSATTLNILAAGTGAVTTPSGGNLYLTAGSGAITINAPVTNGGGTTNLVKSGSGTVILLGADNTFGGTISVNAGTLQFGASQINTLINGGTYNGNIYIAGGAALTLQGNSSNILGGIISGDGNLNLNRGTTTLSGANTYTGKTSMSLVATNAVGSTLNVSSFNSVFTDVGLGTVHSASSSLGAPTTVQNGIIDLGGAVQVTAQINYTGSGETTDRIINFVFNGSSSRVIDTSGTPNSLLKFTSAPISNGTNSSVILQGSSNGEFVGGLPFSFANFTKNGAGTWTLGGPLGSTGTTTISAGTLILNGSKPSTGTVAVNGTSTLGGNGTIAGTVTVAAGAKLTPGTSVGTLTFTGALDISAMAGGAGVINMELGPIATSDKIVAGTINIGELAFDDFSFSAITGLQNGTYTLIQSGGITGGLDPDSVDITGPVGSGTGTLQITGNNIELLVSGIGGGGSNYSTWATANGITGEPFGGDFDNDGITNGVEYGLGLDPKVSSVPAGVLSGNTITFTKGADAIANDDVSWIIETSETLVAGSWTAEVTQANTNNDPTIAYSFTPGTPAKKFARLKVVQVP